MKADLIRRPRRNRSHSNIRALVRETHLRPEDFIQPLFVKEGKGASEPVKSMPGVARHSVRSLVGQCREVARLGIPAVAIFPCIPASRKDARGTIALEKKNVLYHAIAEVKSACPDLLVVTDVALDPYTDHGHDGVLQKDGRDVANDETVEILEQLALLEAQAGADIVAPSDMMDGRVRAIRRALDENGYGKTGILSYAVKFASAYYGPFRDAVGSARKKGTAIDKKGYQMDPANVREALLEAKLDEEEGADILMVKPAGPYLDIIRLVRQNTLLPLAAYQVSGEYSQIHAAARLGWLSYEQARDESLLAIKRAGAEIILSYFAKEVVKNLR